MLSTTQIVLEYVFPGLGIITSTLMFTAPLRDVIKATREDGKLGNLNPTPWAVMLGNTYGWVAYSCLVHNLFVFFSNAPCLILSLWFNFQAIKLQYGEYRTKNERKLIVRALEEESSRYSTTATKIASTKANSVDQSTYSTSEEEENEERQGGNDAAFPATNPATDTKAVILMDYAKLVWGIAAQTKQAPISHELLVLAIVTFWTAVSSLITLGRASLSLETQALIVGISVNCNLLFFYGAPLSTIFEVLKTKSSRSIHIPTMILNTFNSTLWASFGFAVRDYYLGIPNGLGALLGVVQILLCVLFPRKQEQQQDDEGLKQGGDEGCIVFIPDDKSSATTATANPNQDEVKANDPEKQ